MTMRKIPWIVFACFFLSACADPAEKREKVETVKSFVRDYVELLPAVYRQEDPSLLRGTAADREILAVARNLNVLHAKSYNLEVALVDLQFTYVDIYNVANAFVKTTEVWDVTTRNAETGEVRGAKRGELLHVTYQLKNFVHEGWLVTGRMVEETRKPRQ